MKPLLPADVFHRQLVSGLVAENGLVLRAVVHKDPSNILHEGDGGQIAYKYSHFQETLEDTAPVGDGLSGQPVELVEQKGGQVYRLLRMRS